MDQYVEIFCTNIDYLEPEDLDAEMQNALKMDRSTAVNGLTPDESSWLAKKRAAESTLARQASATQGVEQERLEVDREEQATCNAALAHLRENAVPTGDFRFTIRGEGAKKHCLALGLNDATTGLAIIRDAKGHFKLAISGFLRKTPYSESLQSHVTRIRESAGIDHFGEVPAKTAGAELDLYLQQFRALTAKQAKKATGRCYGKEVGVVLSQVEMPSESLCAGLTYTTDGFVRATIWPVNLPSQFWRKIKNIIPRLYEFGEGKLTKDEKAFQKAEEDAQASALARELEAVFEAPDDVDEPNEDATEDDLETADHSAALRAESEAQTQDISAQPELATPVEPQTASAKRKAIDELFEETEPYLADVSTTTHKKVRVSTPDTQKAVDRTQPKTRVALALPTGGRSSAALSMSENKDAHDKQQLNTGSTPHRGSQQESSAAQSDIPPQSTVDTADHVRTQPAESRPASRKVPLEAEFNRETIQPLPATESITSAWLNVPRSDQVLHPPLPGSGQAHAFSAGAQPGGATQVNNTSASSLLAPAAMSSESTLHTKSKSKSAKRPDVTPAEVALTIHQANLYAKGAMNCVQKQNFIKNEFSVLLSETVYTKTKEARLNQLLEWWYNELWLPKMGPPRSVYDFAYRNMTPAAQHKHWAWDAKQIEGADGQTQTVSYVSPNANKAAGLPVPTPANPPPAQEQIDQKSSHRHLGYQPTAQPTSSNAVPAAGSSLSLQSHATPATWLLGSHASNSRSEDIIDLTEDD